MPRLLILVENVTHEESHELVIFIFDPLCGLSKGLPLLSKLSILAQALLELEPVVRLNVQAIAFFLLEGCLKVSCSFGYASSQSSI